MKNGTTLKLKKLGLRITPQRQAILKLLKGYRTHPSADRIYQEISKGYPGISFATVYNTLSKLAEAGEIRELDIDPDKKRFDPFITPHAHFYCKVCGRVFDIDHDPRLPLNQGTIDGHQVETVQLNLKGVCKDCRRKRHAKPVRESLSRT
jgi:Fur family peroxide stress response transcriptional regulator